MRKAFYGLLILLSFLSPVERLDVAKLQPVEAVAVYAEEDWVILETDTEDVGKGRTAQLALQDLKSKAPAVIYLDTARYLLVGEGAEEYAAELKACLKKNVRIRRYMGGEIQEEVRYLDAHDRSAEAL